MSHTGKPLNPQKRLLPTSPRVGHVAIGDGQTWQTTDLAATIQSLIDASGKVTVTNTTTSEDATPLSTDRIIGVFATFETIDVNLPAASSYPIGEVLTIKDQAGNAETYPITISAASGLIDDDTPVATNGGWAQFYTDGINWFRCGQSEPIIASPNGTKWRVTVDNAGTMSAVAV